MEEATKSGTKKLFCIRKFIGSIPIDLSKRFITPELGENRFIINPYTITHDKNYGK